MKAVILAGGLGTRLSEDTAVRPKPMVEIGGKPILWHILKSYSHHGINDFIICCGYRGNVIKEYFSNYFLHSSDITFNLNSKSVEVHDTRAEPWSVTLVDTGETAMTGGRLRKIEKYVENEDAFCMTYGDGLSNVNIAETIKFHRDHGKQATLVASFAPGRFGHLKIDKDSVIEFAEKPQTDEARINGGFFVLSPKVLKLIHSDDTSWEMEPLSQLSNKGELMAFKHDGFWRPMDTLSDKIHLNSLWDKNEAPWKVW